MILEFIINIIKKFVLWVISLFPTLPSFEWLFDAVAPVINVLNVANMFISVPVFCSCAVIVFAVNNSELVWSFIMFIVHKLPFGLD